MDVDFDVSEPSEFCFLLRLLGDCGGVFCFGFFFLRGTTDDEDVLDVVDDATFDEESEIDGVERFEISLVPVTDEKSFFESLFVLIDNDEEAVDDSE